MKEMEIERLKQENARLKDALWEILESMEMLHDENYDLQAWREAYLLNWKEIGEKAVK